MIERGFCHCGCGQRTNIARRTISSLGWKKGEPFLWVVGHHNRKADADAKAIRNRVLQRGRDEKRRAKAKKERAAKAAAKKTDGKHALDPDVQRYRLERAESAKRTAATYQQLMANAEAAWQRQLARDEQAAKGGRPAKRKHGPNIYVFSRDAELSSRSTTGA